MPMAVISPIRCPPLGLCHNVSHGLVCCVMLEYHSHKDSKAQLYMGQEVAEGFEVI
jgi:hypothetical protein